MNNLLKDIERKKGLAIKPSPSHVKTFTSP